MHNAKREFLGMLQGCYWGTETPVSPMKAALLTYGDGKKEVKFALKVGFAQADLDAFFDSMSDAYPHAWSHHFMGTIWLEDGTWFSRDFDLSEVDWEHWEMPVIPDELLPAFSKCLNLTNSPIIDIGKGFTDWSNFFRGVIRNNQKFFELNGDR